MHAKIVRTMHSSLFLPSERLDMISILWTFLLNLQGELEIVFDSGTQPSSSEMEFHVNPRIVRVISLYIMFLFTWQRLFRISDTGIGVLFLFVATLFTVLVTRFGLDCLNEFVTQLPKNITQARNYVGHCRDNFTRYVSCPKCHYVYDLDICKIQMPDKSFQSRKCTYMKFPNHPQLAHRKKCDTVLIKTVKTSAGTTVLQPQQIFCYRKISEALQDCIKRPNFIQQCELWRSRKVQDDTLCDVYDGKVWTEFMDPDQTPFLSVPYNFALALNID